MWCSKLDVMVISKRKILNKGCVFTNHTRNVDYSIFAYELCAFDSCRTNLPRCAHDIISAHGGCAIDHKREMLMISECACDILHGGCASDSCRTNQPRNADDSISALGGCASGSCCTSQPRNAACS